MARAVEQSNEGMCVSAVASNVLGEEMADAFLAEITMDMRHMGLFVAQAQDPSKLLLLGVDAKEDEQTGEDNTHQP